MRNEFIAVYELDDSRPRSALYRLLPGNARRHRRGRNDGRSPRQSDRGDTPIATAAAGKNDARNPVRLVPRRRPRNNRRSGNRGSAPRPANPVLNPAAAKSRRQEENMTTLAQKETPETLTPTFKYQKPEAVVCNEFYGIRRAHRKVVHRLLLGNPRRQRPGQDQRGCAGKPGRGHTVAAGNPPGRRTAGRAAGSCPRNHCYPIMLGGLI